MPKNGTAKTRKAVSKRFKKTGSGKFVRHRQGKRHLLRNKNAKRRRRLRKATLASDADSPRIRENMPFS